MLTLDVELGRCLGVLRHSLVDALVLRAHPLHRQQVGAPPRLDVVLGALLDHPVVLVPRHRDIGLAELTVEADGARDLGHLRVGEVAREGKRLVCNRTEINQSDNSYAIVQPMR